ncbi:MAG: class I SAM-dependent methyltransferase [Holophaga sp.]|nr:class I SAM-dependent methyltransferase [Holophaga sp.]
MFETPMSNRTLILDDPLHRYLLAHSLREHPQQAALREFTRSHPGAGMQISPEQGALMQVLVRLMAARRCLEVGVFTGYSALTVALALPEDGYLLACDVNADYTAIALPFWRRAGVAARIELALGPALATLDDRLARGEAGSFDFAFIDADKTSYDGYFERCFQLLRTGGLIAIDNVLWSGRVARPGPADPETSSLRELNAKLHQDERVDLAMVPIGDGLTLARKR